MKSLFKILCFISIVSSIDAREIIVITYDREREMAKMVGNIIEHQENIPKKLISYRFQKSPCQSIDDSILHACIKNGGEVKFMHIEKQTILEAFSIFRNKNMGGIL